MSGELLYTGRLLDTSEAVRTGLANRAFLGAELDGAVERIVAAIAAQPAATRAAKRSIGAVRSALGDRGNQTPQPAVSWPDFDAGVRAFLSRSGVL